MQFFKKIVACFLIVISISSCGVSKRIYFTPENKIALSPRGYSSSQYKQMNSQKQQIIQKRNRRFMVALIVTANAFIFVPLFLNQKTDDFNR
jgi:predicted small lipoprotein YifL